ncbi:MAG: nucleotidyltransferase family protein [Nitrospirae bacterium]|nr:nucleotidyltransferase family protein [Nitrospirota bacterium]
MRALLLSAGLWTRLRPMTNMIPKCLVPIHGKPLLEYWLKMLRDASVYPILLNLHYFADRVQRYIANSEFRDIVQTVYEKKLFGTAGTLLKNRVFFGNETLMLIHADNLSRFDVQAFIERHKKRPAGCEITMMVFKTPTPYSCGIVELDENGIVQAFYEKVPNPPSNLANGAVYILEPSIFDYLQSLNKEFIDFSTEVLPIGTMESYKKALEEFR